METSLIASVPVVARIAVIVWLAGLGLQWGDLAGSLISMRNARQRAASGSVGAGRRFERFWVWPVLVTTAVGAVLGADVAARLATEAHEPLLAVLVLALTVCAVLGIGVCLLGSDAGRAGVDYASLLAQLSGGASTASTASTAASATASSTATGHRFSAEQLAAVRAHLGEVDARERRIRLGFRDRAALPALRAELESLSQRFRTAPPLGAEAFRAIGWSAAAGYLFRAAPLRVLAVAVAFAPGVAVIADSARTGDWQPWLVAVLLIKPPVVSAVLALAAARVALAAKVVSHAVNLAQRADVVDRIESIDRSARKGVAGLGDRVARALQILREQGPQ